jgi:ABC-type Fe3+-hydroxamate transport system substrate-binding protein
MFYNLESLAAQIFQGIRQRYLCERQAAAISANIKGNPSPLVAWASVYNQQISISTAAYKKQLTQDAGGQMFTPTTTFLTSSAAFSAELAAVDILIDETYNPGTTYTWQNFLTTYNLSSTSPLKFVQTGQVWREDGLVTSNGSLDWLQGAVPNVEEVLSDFIIVTTAPPYPTPVAQKPIWFRRVEDMTPTNIVSTSNCFTGPSNLTAAGSGCSPMGCATTGLAASADLFPDKVTVVSATLFTVQYFGTYKVATVTNGGSTSTFVLYMCGTTPPSMPSATMVIQIPVQQVMIPDTTVLRFMQLLGVQLTIRFLQQQYTTSPCLSSMVTNGGAEELQYNAAYTSYASSQLAQVDVAFEGYPMSSKSIPFVSTSEPSLLGRAEWIKFLALFYNLEGMATQLFDSTRTRYLCHRQAAAEAAIGQPMLNMAWTSYNSYSGTWSLLPASYKQTLIIDAGANPVLPPAGDPGTYSNSAEFLSHLQTADVLIDDSYTGVAFDWNSFLTLYNLTASSQLKIVQNQQVWRVDNTEASFSAWDWYEGAVAEADAVLLDFLAVAHPPASGSAPEGRWLRRVATQQPMGIGSCSNNVPPVVPLGLASPCTLTVCPVAAVGATSTSLFPVQAVPTMAQLYTVQYFSTYKLVTVTDFGVTETYVLYQCGTTPPVITGAKLFSIPLQTVAVADSTLLRFFELLGLQLSLRLLEQGEVTSPCLLEMQANGGALGLQYDASGNLRAAQLVTVDALFTYSTGVSNNSIANAATSEATMLARAEWIKFIALFYNQEALALQVFNNISERYLCTRTTTAVTHTGQPPVVAWTNTYTSTNSAGQTVQTWEVSTASYQMNLLQDAGVTPLVVPGGGMFTSATAFAAAIQGADFIVDEAYDFSLSPQFTFTTFLNLYGLQSINGLTAIQTQEVLRVDGLQANPSAWDWYEGAVAEADAVLQDFTAAFHGSPLPGRWLRRLSTTPQPTLMQAAMCPNGPAMLTSAPCNCSSYCLSPQGMCANATQCVCNADHINGFWMDSGMGACNMCEYGFGDHCTTVLPSSSLLVCSAGVMQLLGASAISILQLGPNSTSGGSAGTITVQGPTTGLSGPVTCGGLYARNLATLAFTTGAALILEGIGSLTNVAGVTLSEVNLTLASGSALTVASSAIFRGTGQLLNSGTFTVNGVGALVQMFVTMAGSGLTVISAGTLLLAAAETLLGTVNISSAGTLRVEQDTTFSPSAIVTGLGRVWLVGATLTCNRAKVSVPVLVDGTSSKIQTQSTTATLQGSGQVAGSLTLSNGALVVDMAQSMSVSGSFSAVSSTITYTNVAASGNNPLAIGGAATLTNTQIVITSTSALQALAPTSLVLMTFGSGATLSGVSVSMPSYCIMPTLSLTGNELVLTWSSFSGGSGGSSSGAFPWWAIVVIILCVLGAGALVAWLAYTCHRRNQQDAYKQADSFAAGAAAAVPTDLEASSGTPAKELSHTSSRSTGDSSSVESYLVYDADANQPAPVNTPTPSNLTNGTSAPTSGGQTPDPYACDTPATSGRRGW